MPKNNDDWNAWEDSLETRQDKEESEYERWEPETYSVKEWIKYRFSREGVDAFLVTDIIEDFIWLIKDFFSK